MTTDFKVLSGETVAKDYSWDIGAPFGTAEIQVPAYTTSGYISGYAPGLLVAFNNDSTYSSNYEQIPEATFYADFSWDFGDYYNNLTNNVSLSCAAPVRHIYVMPGKYTVTLTHTEAYSLLIIDDSLLCKGKYDINWYWDNLVCDVTTQRKWDELQCGARFEKNWEEEIQCFGKYCKDWVWKQLDCNGGSETTWLQTKPGQPFEKKWQFEANDTACSRPFAETQTTTNSNIQTVIKKFIVEVVEIPPTAALHSVTRPAYGTSPYRVQLTAHTTKCGSFPINRIDWDFGDGSPIKTVTREGNNNIDPELIFTNIYANDSLDVRNYDVVHTYIRNNQDYAVFYPSITAYSANTSTHDSCSTTIGPISFPSSNRQVSLLKLKNTTENTLYALSYNNNCSLLTTKVSTISTPLKTTLPKNRVQDSFNTPINYTGNNGAGYPPVLPQTCEGYQRIIPFTKLVMEESITLTNEITAITQQNDGFIVVG